MLLAGKYLFRKYALYVDGELADGCCFEESIFFDRKGVEHQISNYRLLKNNTGLKVIRWSN